MANILVAGAGHGGLTAAALLATAGHTVTVLEKGSEDSVGHDWTDIFNLACFHEAGIPMPPESAYEPACHMTFFSPARNRGVSSYIRPEECTESNMERKEILRRLLAFARERGVALRFGTQVLRPLAEGNRITGLEVQTADGVHRLAADLVIDAAGMHLPVRSQLPESCGIVRRFAGRQFFNVYRAFYNESGNAPLTDDPFNVYFFPQGEAAVSWVARELGYVDLLYGRFTKNTPAAAEELRLFMTAIHPELGDAVRRGGQVNCIPVRRPIPVMVADGYAAVGDSAAMTVPIVGAGICNSIRAGRFLAETILAQKEDPFSVAALWQYQVRYMREIGAVHASLDVLKGFLLGADARSLDFLFDKGIMDSAMLVKARTGQEIKLTLPKLARSGLHGYSRPGLLLRLAGVMANGQRLKRHSLRIPAQYSKAAVTAWAKAYAQY
ncbi:MAG: FAD-dependent oxidoreductase [Oscillospiraceae bacterium]|jgi:flavin-dependent dehydrogenase|nr:FAD-dependent oxidoreductase [Oscillospiraceae bacterium]